LTATFFNYARLAGNSNYHEENSLYQLIDFISTYLQRMCRIPDIINNLLIVNEYQDSNGKRFALLSIKIA